MRKRSENKPHLQVTAGLVWDGPKILITRRPPGIHMEGFWEFPGGKKEHEENLEQCLRRELMEELGLEVKVREQFARAIHEYEDRIVDLYVFNCDIVSGRATGKESQEIRWVRPEELNKYCFPPPDAAIIKKILGQGRRKD